MLSGGGRARASLPACLLANAPHWHVSVRVNHRCLFLSRAGLLQTSHGSPLRLPLPRAGTAQVTQGDMTSMPPIHQTARKWWEKAKRAKFGGVITHYKQTASKLCKNLVAFKHFLEVWHKFLFPGCTVSLCISCGGFVHYSLYLDSPAEAAASHTCQYLFYLHANVWNIPCNGQSCLSGSIVEGNISSLTSALCNSELIHLTAVPCCRPCSSVWCPLTQTPLHSKHMSMHAHTSTHTHCN